ncbi:TPA: helix-turn-helix transcriptional regulator [Staphylococcus aureus]|nr:helix-turn-helix transcriptional regulator [Staphylococcus aureus]
MIRNRLSELLSERGLKTSRVAKEVGIARSSLTSMIQNDSEMIRYDAIDKLCNYLNITPTKFFDYSPLNFEFILDEEPTIDVSNIFFELSSNLKDGIAINKFNFDVLIDVYDENHVKYSFDLEIYFDRFQKNKKNKYDLIFSITNESEYDELKQNVNILTPGLKNVLYKKVQKLFTAYVINLLKSNLDDEKTKFNNVQTSLHKELDQAQCILENSIFTEY